MYLTTNNKADSICCLAELSSLYQSRFARRAEHDDDQQGEHGLAYYICA